MQEVAAETSPAGSPGSGSPNPVVFSVAALALLSLLLPVLDVTSASHLIDKGRLRPELVALSLTSLVLFLVLRLRPFQRSFRFDGAFALLLPLAGILGLLLEPLSLLLHPDPFELAWFAPAYSPIVEANAEPVTFDWPSVVIATSLSVAAIATYLKDASPQRRNCHLRCWFVANLVAVGILFACPVAGPFTEFLPLPPASIGPDSAAMADLPRLGLLSLPCFNAALLAIWSVRRDHDKQRWDKLLTGVVAVSTLAVVALELAAHRYSYLSVALAIGLACVLEVAGNLASVRFSRVQVREQPLGTDGTAEPSASRQRNVLTVVFFLSGMAALVYQVVYAKGLALTFGSTSHASTIVLATYMGGLALGSWYGGRLAERLKRPVLGYAFAELGIAALCAASPVTLKLARWLYVAIAQGADPSEGWLVGLQLLLGALVLVPPTFLMGLTMPLLTRQFLDNNGNLGASAGLLYTANTLGAATGACITGYAVLPALGITYSLYAAVATNVCVCMLAIVAANLARPTATGALNQTSPLQELRALRHPKRQARWLGIVAVVQLSVGGFVTFGLETSFVHLLATVAGTSAYAFSLMLFAFLIGLSLGANLVRHRLPAPQHLPVLLLLCQFVLALTLLVGTAYWDMLPGYFASFGRWPFALTFAAREFIRFVVCLVVMVPPAICIGAQFPIAMEAVGIGWPKTRLAAMGWASALNTLGNILGAIVVGFVLLPRLGSHRTLACLVVLCLLLAALAWTATERRFRPLMGGLLALGALGLALSPPNFDLTRLASGGNVYFKPQYYGRVIESAESLDGGLTTVALSFAGANNPVKTLLTNGKFQGNDRRDHSGEMVAQTSFAIAPLLHTEARQRALVIGFGTGTTTRVLDEAGFAHVDVAELSGDIIRLADRHFYTINEHVIRRPNVQVHVTDGRNFLLLDRHQYDLVSIELSSIWFAGAANLYNDEFYELVEQRLAPGGVLQQWVQLHRLSHRDIVSILTTIKRRFPYAWLYFMGKQGIVVACKQNCIPEPKHIARLLGEERLEATLSVFPNGLRSVLYGRLLTPDGLSATLAEYVEKSGLSEQALLSTDDNLYLEYSTPRGNVREYDESIFDNEQFLARRRPLSPFEGTHLDLATVPDGVDR